MAASTAHEPRRDERLTACPSCGYLSPGIRCPRCDTMKADLGCCTGACFTCLRHCRLKKPGIA